MEIPKKVSVPQKGQYINQPNNFMLNNDQQNERMTFNPLEYIPQQNSVPLEEQQYMPMVSPRYQLNEQKNNNQPSNTVYGLDTNDMMNNRIFNTDYLIQGSLVPINKHHHFSRNLFQEGVPIPQDLQQQYFQQQNQWSQHGYQNGHQYKAKTLYKDELNARMQDLSPMSDKLFMPVDNTNGELNKMYQQSMILSPEEQKRISNTSNRGNRRDEMNQRMNQYEPLSSVMTTSKKNDIAGFQPPSMQ
jgi:hypothetical protein